MTPACPTLIDRLLANHIVIGFPRINAAQERSRRLPHRLLVKLHLGGIRIALAQAGYDRFLDHIDQNAAGNWCIHLFLTDQEAMSVVQENTQGVLEPADPASFDAEVFVEQHLHRLQCCD